MFVFAVIPECGSETGLDIELPKMLEVVIWLSAFCEK